MAIDLSKQRAKASVKRSKDKTVGTTKTAKRSTPNGLVDGSPRRVPEPDERRAMRTVMELLAIPGTSGQEGQVVETIIEKLRRAGAPADSVCTDQAHKKTPLKGEVGNLIFKLPGTLPGPRRLLMAHVDTVPICVGTRPVRKGDWVESGNKQTGLGADDRAGAAAVLNTALEILEHDLPHPPLTFFWPVQEEVGLHGARHVQLSLLGKPRLAFNWDGGSPEKITMGATGGYRMAVTVRGLASHAGVAPEEGVSAIAIASLAVAELARDGWHGDVRRGEKRGTTNVGYIHGGGATNVVTDQVELKIEARSHDPAFRAEIVQAIEQAFHRAAQAVRSASGVCGSVAISGALDYESFRLAEDEPCVLAAEAAVRSIGVQPLRAISNGGLDANWMTAHGIPTVTLGCGQVNVHTVSEKLDVAAFRKACRIALRLATGTA